MSSDSTPVSRLRERHRLWPILDRPDVQLCIECTDPYPCDVIAALDELEERDDLSYEPEAPRALAIHFGLKGAIDYATKIFQMGGPLAKEYGWLADYLTTYKAATEVGLWPKEFSE